MYQYTRDEFMITCFKYIPRPFQVRFQPHLSQLLFNLFTMSQHQTHTLIRDISPTYEDHDGDHEWDSFNQADLDLLDEIDAQHIQASMSFLSLILFDKSITKPPNPNLVL